MRQQCSWWKCVDDGCDHAMKATAYKLAMSQHYRSASLGASPLKISCGGSGGQRQHRFIVSVSIPHLNGPFSAACAAQG